MEKSTLKPIWLCLIALCFSSFLSTIQAQDGCETAFAFDPTTGQCFSNDGFNRWGWTNYYTEEGTYSLDLYAGAGQCDTDKGTLVGTVTIDYMDGEVSVSYQMISGFILNDAHIYVGSEKYPSQRNGKPTVAPGKFNNNPDEFSGSLSSYEVAGIEITGPIWVIVHGVTCSDNSPSDTPNDDPDDGNSDGDPDGGDPDGGDPDGGDSDGGDPDGGDPDGGDPDGGDPDGGDPDGGDPDGGDPDGGDPDGNPADDPYIPTRIENPDGSKLSVSSSTLSQEITLNYSFEYDTELEIQIFSVNGRLIKSTKAGYYKEGSQGRTTMDLSGIDQQLLFVQVTSKRERLVKKTVL